ncbi:MAG: hypothetical protein U9R79_17955 [Armatimonadota bacterium]|nr:hypothetical protein [Armatimonadota bacterium]
MSQHSTDEESKELTVEDAIIEVREHTVIVDREILDALAEAEEPGPACGIVKPGFLVTASDYQEGRYDE